MKQKWLSLIWAYLFCMGLHAENRVLFIGIGNYPEAGGWPTISGNHDITLLSPVFPSSFRQITYIDEQATFAQIESGLRQLVEETIPGDTVWVHFSGHGQQLLGDEADGLDESLVPYDAPCRKTSSYTGQCHLVDNILGQYLQTLRERVSDQGLVMVTLDACFSDSMDRGEATTSKDPWRYRGGKDIFGSDQISAERMRDLQQRRRYADTLQLHTVKGWGEIAIVSACRTWERNREVVVHGKGYGSLSYAMYVAFQTKGFSDLGNWLDMVFQTMEETVYTQVPQIRTSLDYQRPTRTVAPSREKTLPEIENNEQPLQPLFIAGVVLLVILLILIIISWKHKKK